MGRGTGDRGQGGWRRIEAPFEGGQSPKRGCSSIHGWNLPDFIPKFFIPHFTTFQISFP